MDDSALRAAARRAGVQHIDDLSRPKLLDEIFQALVESKLEAPTFVVDYPVELSPLAKPKRGDPRSPSGSSCSRTGGSSRMRSAS